MSTLDFPTIDLFDTSHDTNTESMCKGVVFRYTEGAFRTKRGYGFSRQLSILKRQSCPGCSECIPTLDDINEGIADFGMDFFEFSPHLKNGDLVVLQFVVDSTDWEMGYIDTWHYKVVKVRLQV